MEHGGSYRLAASFGVPSGRTRPSDVGTEILWRAEAERQRLHRLVSHSGPVADVERAQRASLLFLVLSPCRSRHASVQTSAPLGLSFGPLAW